MSTVWDKQGNYLKLNPDGSVNTNTVGGLVRRGTDITVLANTDIFTDYTSTVCQNTTLQVATDTTGVLSLETDGVLNKLNGGVALEPNNLYAFNILLIADIAYNLQLSANATMQINWAGGI